MTYNRVLRNQRLGEVPNNAGGLAYEVDMWQQLRRFLILGSENGTYYVTPQKLTADNARNIQECLNTDPERTINEIVYVSENNLGIKNSTCIFALAVASTSPLALGVLNRVLRTGSHLLEYVSYIEELNIRGWGRAFKRAIADWYLSKTPEQVAYQTLKYFNRNKWTQRDILRKAHPKPINEDMGKIFAYLTKETLPHTDSLADWVHWASITDDKSLIIALIRDYNLTHEMIPSRWQSDPDVWTALLEKMPMTAMLRSLARTANLGILEVGSVASDIVMDKITPESIAKSRVHPFQLLLAGSVYGKGRSNTTGKSWFVNSQIVDVITQAFYASFGNVDPIEGNVLVGIDRSGSMQSSVVSGSAMEGMPAGIAAAAQALIFAHAAPKAEFVLFNTSAEQFVVNKHWTINDFVRNMRINGGTACSSVIDYATKRQKKYDAIIVLTDSESWADVTRTYSVYQGYRQHYNPDCKLITVAMCSNNFTLGNPQDRNTLDCVGFDLGTPQAISYFLKGEV